MRLSTPPLAFALALCGLLAWPLAAAAQPGDEVLFSTSGSAPPNLLILLDSSGSMGGSPSGCKDTCDRKRDMAGRAIRDLVTAVNPPDGEGGYINNARLGFAIFTGSGGRLLVPVGEDTVQAIVNWVTLPDIPTAADALNKIGGNSHGLAVMEMARYFAHESTFGPFPPWGFGSPLYSGPPYPASFPDVVSPAKPGDFPNEDPRIPSVWDLACRPSFLILIDDGLWGGSDGGRFGGCRDMDGDLKAESCALEFIGDISGNGEFWMEDITKKMLEYDFAPDLDGVQYVTTHVIGFDEPKAVDLMRTTAELGGGTFHFATNEEELTQALMDITVNIFDSLASFAGVAIPSSRTAGGSYLFNAFFEPKATESMWAGHLESWRLSPSGEILDKDGNPATNGSGQLLSPHNPYWDAGTVLKTNTSRSLFTTKSGSRVVLNTTNVSIEDLALESADPPPPPPPDPCDPVAANLPAGYYFGFPNLTAPYEAKPGAKVKVRYCVPASRFGKKKDFIGTFPVGATGTDAIDLFERGDKDATACVFDPVTKLPTSGFKDKDLNVGKQELRIQVRIYLENNFTSTGLAAWGPSLCVKADAGGTPPPPPPNPDFAPYPNATKSGIDTYAELQKAVIDFAYGKDAFDQDGDLLFTDMRQVVLGDIFHSTPVVVGAPTLALLKEAGFSGFRSSYRSRDQVVYVGANDGMLHAFDAGSFHEGDDPATPEVENGYYDPGTGAELFGYVPGLLLDKLKMLSRNKPRTTYYVDGSPVAADAWLGDGSGSDTTKSADEWATVLITGFREGGPGYLALDITNPGAGVSDPHGPYPKFLWEFTHARLGEAWSKPVVTRIKVRADSGTGDQCGKNDGDGDCREQWVAIFGGGYHPKADPNEFTFVGDPSAAGWTDRSKAIFMVDLATGEILDMVAHDPYGLDGPSEMIYSLPGTPGVVDLDFDGFADVVYIGDLGGQMWKWDVSAVGEDSDLDGVVDNWSSGRFFVVDPVDMGDGTTRYRSFFNTPGATLVGGKLVLAFGTGEREDPKYAGKPSVDENNRFYVVYDFAPTGTGAFDSITTESDLTDVTGVDKDTDPGDAGFFIIAADGEKFVTDATIFAGQVIVASFTPEAGEDLCTTAGGQALLYVLSVKTGEGYFAGGESPTAMQKRREVVGGGLPSNPSVSLAPNASGDRIYIKTSTGEIIEIEPPDRTDEGLSIIYWRLVD